MDQNKTRLALVVCAATIAVSMLFSALWPSAGRFALHDFAFHNPERGDGQAPMITGVLRLDTRTGDMVVVNLGGTASDGYYLDMVDLEQIDHDDVQREEAKKHLAKK